MANHFTGFKVDITDMCDSFMTCLYIVTSQFAIRLLVTFKDAALDKSICQMWRYHDSMNQFWLSDTRVRYK